MFSLFRPQRNSLKIVIFPKLVRISCIGIKPKPGKDWGASEELDSIGGQQYGRVIIKNVKVPHKQDTKSKTPIWLRNSTTLYK